MDALSAADPDLYQEALISELAPNTRVAYGKGWSRFVDYALRKE